MTSWLGLRDVATDASHEASGRRDLSHGYADTLGLDLSSLDLQSTQNSGLLTLHFSLKASTLDTLEVQVYVSLPVRLPLCPHSPCSGA